jgi:hypothetical protein
MMRFSAMISDGSTPSAAAGAVAFDIDSLLEMKS